MSRFLSRRRNAGDQSESEESESHTSGASSSEEELSGEESDDGSEAPSASGEDGLAGGTKDLAMTDGPQANSTASAKGSAEESADELECDGGDLSERGDDDEEEMEFDAAQADGAPKQPMRAIASAGSAPESGKRGQGAKRVVGPRGDGMDEYRRKLKEDPAFTPSIGKFWGHDDRFSGQDRGRGGFGRGRGRGGIQRGPPPFGAHQPTRPEAAAHAADGAPAVAAQPSPQRGFFKESRTLYDTENDPTEKPWVHDKFEEVADSPRPRHRKSWAPRDSESRKSYTVGDHVVTTVKHKAGATSQTGAPAVDDKAKQATQKYYTAHGGSDMDRHRSDQTPTQQPRQSKRYLKSAKAQDRQTAEDVSKSVTAALETSQGGVSVADAVSTAAEAKTLNSEATSFPETFVPRSKSPPKKRTTKRAPYGPPGYDQYPMGTTYQSAPPPPMPQPGVPLAAPHLMTNSGQVVMMTDTGLYVPADAYSNNYMYQTPYPAYMYPQSYTSQPHPGDMPSSTYGYYGHPGGQMFYPPPLTMYDPSGSGMIMPAAAMPVYNNGMYMPQVMPNIPFQAANSVVTSTIADQEQQPVQPIQVRRPNDGEIVQLKKVVPEKAAIQEKPTPKIRIRSKDGEEVDIRSFTAGQ
ncbi:hypothetical protein DFJ77DRAFT_465285 [Powellomyces hirtus]|nr:hypothetical protein DFJ77DRAFT_465285 [Powellomyces hirtus]